MTQAGGPAAINGFLYQIMHHLGWLAEVTLTGKVNGQEVDDGACLVLEPRKGGDARAEASGIYLVEQYKTRTNGTWGLADIETVLRDLRKAVPPVLPAHARYRFVTDGRAGRLDAFTGFLADVKSVGGPDALDNAQIRTFGGNLSVTHRGFFDHIVAVTRSGRLQPSNNERAVVLHLLSQFDMEFCDSRDARAVAVEKLLRHFAPDLGDERRIREHLIGVLVEKLSQGEVRFTAAELDALFRHVGLNPDRMRNLAKLAETMNALTARRLARLKYRREADVRSAPHWPDGKPVLLIAGESGAGKTWQLGRLMEALGQDRHIGTLVPAADTSEAILARAAQDIWHYGLGETSEKTLLALTHVYREIAPGAAEPWLTIAVDDVQDVDLARSLVRQDWSLGGMRLVLTVPTSISRTLELTDGDAVHVHRVADFSVDELDTLLKQARQKWADLPPDLKKLLRNPILAGLFLGLPYHSVRGAPHSEYEIFEGFWQRIAARGRPGDEGIVLALAGHMREGKAYPLPRPAWQEIGLTDESQLARLDAAGWLRCNEAGEVGFAHDRLLNWAVAKWSVNRYAREEFSVDALSTWLLGTPDEQKRRLLRRQVYVPMDALWLLAGNENDHANLGRLIALLEESHEYGSYGEDLYVQLLPTLGQRAIPILIERLGTITSAAEGDYRVGLIGKALASLGRQEAIELDDAIDALLSASSRDRQAVAIAALTAAPVARHLDRLWDLHQERLSAFEAKTDRSTHLDHDASFGALRVGTACHPKWLRQRILSSDPQKEPVSELAYLLCNLEGTIASDIWQATRKELMAKVSVNKPRSLLNCIARFRDREMVDFVVECLKRPEDFASGAALKALTVLDPAVAIDRLVDVEDSERYLTRNEWLPALLRAQPGLTRQRIFDLAKNSADGRRLIENLFWERPDDLDAEMLRYILRDLESSLHSRFEGTTNEDPTWLHHPLEFLGRLARPDLLAILETEAGSELERMISEVACSRLRGAGGYRDHVRENARRVLTLIGGEGITKLINRELESEGYWGRHGGLNWAFIRPNRGTIERLAAIARRPVSRGSNGKPDSDGYQEYYHAMIALGALGVDPELIDAISASGVSEVPAALADLRAFKGPMEKALTDGAAQVLASNASVEDEALAPALVVAWVSGDPDFIPAVRGILSRAEPGGRTAGLACIALRELGDNSTDFARLAMALVPTEENGWLGINALLSLGVQGSELLGSWLKSRPVAAKTQYDASIIRALYDNPATRKLAVDLAVSDSRQNQSFLDTPYDIAAEAGDVTLRETIFDKAFAARSFVATEPLRAIEGLAKFDSTRAIEAIELGLRSNPQMERELCRLLVCIAPEIAAAKLIGAAVEIDRDSFRNAAGRALRMLDRSAVEPMVIEQLTTPSPARKIVAELAGWLPSTAMEQALNHLADQDGTTEVRHSAQAALDRHQREKTACELIAAFPHAPPGRRWVLFVALLEIADPYLLTSRNDPLWLGQILTDEVPEIFAHHAEAEIRRRKQRTT